MFWPSGLPDDHRGRRVQSRVSYRQTAPGDKYCLAAHGAAKIPRTHMKHTCVVYGIDLYMWQVPFGAGSSGMLLAVLSKQLPAWCVIAAHMAPLRPGRGTWSCIQEAVMLSDLAVLLAGKHRRDAHARELARASTRSYAGSHIYAGTLSPAPAPPPPLIMNASGTGFYAAAGVCVLQGQST